MSDEQRFERDARAWLELGPTDAPDRVVEAALLEIDQTSQERDFRVPWRLPTMTPRLGLATTALVGAVVVGLIYLNLPGRADTGALSPTPTLSAPSSTPGSPAPASIEGTWDASYTRQEMLAAGIVDQDEDNPGNYGHFHLTFQSGWWRMDQLSPTTFAGGTATYTVDAAVAHLFSPMDNVTFDIPYTVTATTLTFGTGGPVGFRVEPWTRVATEVITATPEPAAVSAYRQARNAVCAEMFRVSMPPDADPLTNPSGAIAALQAVISRANDEITRLSALTVPASIEAEHLASIQLIRDTLPLLQQEIDLINEGKADQVAAVDQQTAPLSAQFEQFEQKYGLAGCP